MPCAVPVAIVNFSLTKWNQTFLPAWTFIIVTIWKSANLFYYLRKTSFTKFSNIKFAIINFYLRRFTAIFFFTCKLNTCRQNCPVYFSLIMVTKDYWLHIFSQKTLFILLFIDKNRFLTYSKCRLTSNFDTCNGGN